MLINRIGTFFILLGLGLLGLFILSDIADAPSCNFLVFGAILLGIGIFLWLKDPAPPPQPSGRFRLFKRSPKNQDKK
jgi:hypothetical protein